MDTIEKSFYETTWSTRRTLRLPRWILVLRFLQITLNILIFGWIINTAVVGLGSNFKLQIFIVKLPYHFTVNSTISISSHYLWNLNNLFKCYLIQFEVYFSIDLSIQFLLNLLRLINLLLRQLQLSHRSFTLSGLHFTHRFSNCGFILPTKSTACSGG